MKALAEVSETVEIKVDEASSLCTTLILGLSGVVGLWGIACFAGAIYQYGLVGTITGWFSAVIG